MRLNLFRFCSLCFCLMPWSHCMTFKVVIPLHCSHYTNVCLVIRNLELFVVCHEWSTREGHTIQDLSPGGIPDEPVWSPIFVPWLALLQCSSVSPSRLLSPHILCLFSLAVVRYMAPSSVPDTTRYLAFLISFDKLRDRVFQQFIHSDQALIWEHWANAHLPLIWRLLYRRSAKYGAENQGYNPVV